MNHPSMAEHPPRFLMDNACRINLTKHEVRNMCQAIHTFKSNPKANEMEVSFGSFGKSSFQPMFKGESFETLMKALKEQCKDIQDVSWYEGYSTSTQHGNGEKHLLFVDGPNKDLYFSKRKNKLHSLDISAYEFRVSVREEILTHEEIDKGYQAPLDLFKALDIPWTVLKRRWSFNVSELLRFDLTMIVRPFFSSSITDGEIEQLERRFASEKFNVEIEVLKVAEASESVYYDAILNALEKTLHLMNKSPYILLSSSKNCVLDFVKGYINQPPMQAINMPMEKLNELKKYMMTPKVDGVRYWFVILATGYAYLYQPTTKEVILTNICINQYANSILECEVVNARHICLFDTLIVCATDLRGKNDIRLFNRLTILHQLKHVLDRLYSPSSTYFIVNCKPFYGQNVAVGQMLVKQDPLYASLPQDGWIFTPVFLPYPMKGGPFEHLWKWKEEYTIDLMYENNDFFTAHYKDRLNDLHLRLDEDSWNQFIIDHAVIHDGNVIEFIVTSKNSGTYIVPQRIRFDKPYPNSSKTVFDNLKCRRDKVSIDQLSEQRLLIMKAEEKAEVSKEEDATTSEKKQQASPLDPIRKYHNMVKRSNLNQVVELVRSKPFSILDLACGRLGDLPKWNGLNDQVESVLGVDIDGQFLKEGQERLDKCLPMKDKVRLIESDLAANVLENKDNKKYQIVTCNFAIHYFLQDEDTFDRFMTTVNNHIDDHGYFIFTCIDGASRQFVEPAQLADAMPHSKKIEFCDGLAAITINNTVTSDLFGQEMFAVFGKDTDNTMLGKRRGSSEYVVQVDKLIEWIANRYGYDLAWKTSFDKVVVCAFEELTSDAQEFSRIHVACVLQKKIILNEQSTNDNTCNDTGNGAVDDGDIITNEMKDLSIHQRVNNARENLKKGYDAQKLVRRTTKLLNDDNDLMKLTVIDLKKLAKKRGITLSARDRKADIINKLQ